MARALRLTEKDRTLLEFLAEHRIVRANQVQRLLGVSLPTAQRRLKRLGAAGYTERDRIFADQPSYYTIKARGLAAIGSQLKAPEVNQLEYRHDIGMAWVWLAARSGAFGELTGMHSEREMRSRDGSAIAAELSGTGIDPGDRCGIRTFGFGPNGGELLHYPDLLLRTASGHTVAVELELTRKGGKRLDRIIERYASDRRTDAVLYLVDDDRRAKEIIASARRAGAERKIHVQRVRWSEVAGPPPRAARRTAARGRSGESRQSPSRDRQGAQSARGHVPSRPPAHREGREREAER